MILAATIGIASENLLQPRYVIINYNPIHLSLRLLRFIRGKKANIRFLLKKTYIHTY